MNALYMHVCLFFIVYSSLLFIRILLTNKWPNGLLLILWTGYLTLPVLIQKFICIVYIETFSRFLIEVLMEIRTWRQCLRPLH